MPANKSRSAIADFEKQFAELERIVTRMEAGEQSLDDSLTDFEKGMALCQALRHSLEAAEQKVEILISSNETEKLEPLDAPKDRESDE